MEETTTHDDSGGGDAASSDAPQQQQEQPGAGAAAAPTAEFLLHVAQQINRGFQASLAQVRTELLPQAWCPVCIVFVKKVHARHAVVATVKCA